MDDETLFAAVMSAAKDLEWPWQAGDQEVIDRALAGRKDDALQTRALDMLCARAAALIDANGIAYYFPIPEPYQRDRA